MATLYIQRASFLISIDTVFFFYCTIIKDILRIKLWSSQPLTSHIVLAIRGKQFFRNVCKLEKKVSEIPCKLNMQQQTLTIPLHIFISLFDVCTNMSHHFENFLFLYCFKGTGSVCQSGY